MTNSISDPQALRRALEIEARALGFSAVGVARTDAIPQAAERLREWLAAGRHGGMAWMADTAERRAQPNAMWPEALSAVMLGLNYGPERNPLEHLGSRDRGVISVYAQGADYHDLVKSRLKALARWLVAAAAQQHPQVKVFVDTAPLMEKPLAESAGLGWQGKHTNLVSREFGSWLFLGAILTTIDLPPDQPETDHCGSCRACLDICPTAAFPAPYQLDARRCISYLTIEHRGPIPIELRPGIGNRVYGCDDCLAVCPWNKFASASAELKLKARPGMDGPDLKALLALDDTAFRARFSGSPIKRIGRGRLVRNAAIAAGNSGNLGFAPTLAELTGDDDLVVAEAAAWALGQLGGARASSCASRQAAASNGEPSLLRA